MLLALLIGNLGMSRRHSWAARTDVGGDSSWMPVIMGSDSGAANSGGSDCSGADTGAGCGAAVETAVAAATEGQSIAS